MHVLTAFRISSIATVAVVAAFGCLGSRPEGKKASAANQNDASTAAGGAGGNLSEAGGSDSGTGGQGGTSAGGASGAGASSGGASGAGGVPPCEPGSDCSTKCQEKKIDCTTGTPECKFIRNVPDGTDCGGGQVCNAGNCNLCVKDQPCVPAADPCHKGTTSCDPIGCTTTTTMQDDGTPCDDRDRCTSDSSPDAVNPDKCRSGVCTGAPVVCQAQAICHKAGTCDSQTGCSDPLQPEGTACGTNGTCHLGGCVCSSPDILCGTACVNPETNRKHCGECDRDCQSGLCTSRMCQPWIVVPSTDLGGTPPCFATDGMDLVWFLPDSGGKLRKITATGSALTTTLVVQGETPGRLALEDSTVVWTTTSPTTLLVSLWTNPIGAPVSGAPTPLKTLGTAGHSYEPVGLAVDATADHAYFELVEDGMRATIQECTLTVNATCRELGPATPSSGGNDVALGQGYVFWTEATNSRVVRYSLSDGKTTDVVTGEAGPYLLATDTAYVYWAARFNGNFTIKRALQDNPDPSAPENVLTVAVPGTLTTLATDGQNVYYAGMFGRNAKVGYVLVSGGSGQPFFQDTGATQVPPGLLALSKGAVYYFSPADTNIQALVTVR